MASTESFRLSLFFPYDCGVEKQACARAVSAMPWELTLTVPLVTAASAVWRSCREGWAFQRHKWWCRPSLYIIVHSASSFLSRCSRPKDLFELEELTKKPTGFSRMLSRSTPTIGRQLRREYNVDYALQATDRKSCSGRPLIKFGIECPAQLLVPRCIKR